jgi:hypothetical protein
LLEVPEQTHGSMASEKRRRTATIPVPPPRGRLTAYGRAPCGARHGAASLVCKSLAAQVGGFAGSRRRVTRHELSDGRHAFVCWLISLLGGAADPGLRPGRLFLLGAAGRGKLPRRCKGVSCFFLAVGEIRTGRGSTLHLSAERCNSAAGRPKVLCFSVAVLPAQSLVWLRRTNTPSRRIGGTITNSSCRRSGRGENAMRIFCSPTFGGGTGLVRCSNTVSGGLRDDVDDPTCRPTRCGASADRPP